LAGSYYPSPDDYRSYAWGLGISLLIVFFCGVAIYLYRRRRVKPFQEVRFDDAK
jgi:cbb3-type cytochrome oxidase subunit 3